MGMLDGLLGGIVGAGMVWVVTILEQHGGTGVSCAARKVVTVRLGDITINRSRPMRCTRSWFRLLRQLSAKLASVGLSLRSCRRCCPKRWTS